MGKVSEIRTVQLDAMNKYGDDCEASINNISQLFSSSSGSSADLIAIRDGLKSFVKELRESREKLRSVHSDLKTLGAKPITTSMEKHESDLMEKIDDSYELLASIAKEKIGPAFKYIDEFPASASHALSLDVPDSNINLIMYGHTHETPLAEADMMSILDDSGMLKYSVWDDTDIVHIDAESTDSDDDAISSDDTSGDGVSADGTSTDGEPPTHTPTEADASVGKLIPCVWVGPICIPLGPMVDGIIRGLSRCKGTDVAKCRCRCEKAFKRCIGGGGGGGGGGPSADPGTDETEDDDKITRCYNAYNACKSSCN